MTEFKFDFLNAFRVVILPEMKEDEIMIIGRKQYPNEPFDEYLRAACYKIKGIKTKAAEAK